MSKDRALGAKRRLAQCWLMKSEPEAFSIDDLQRLGKSPWDGVRNYQARNYMRDCMRVGDNVLFYHSNANPSGVAGLARVSRDAFPDHTALDPSSPYFDPKASTENPIWWMVEVEFVCRFPHFVSLAELKADRRLATMEVCQRGSRLSIHPVAPDHFERICRLGGAMTP